MRKIPTIYQRDPATNLRHVMNQPHPDCDWVFRGEGVATYKWDGTAVLIDDDNVMWKRREIKAGRPIPDGFQQEGDADPSTGKRVGWVICDPKDPGDRWHRKGFNNVRRDGMAPGTYELVGPKVQGNPHKLDEHQLIRHGTEHPEFVSGHFDDSPTGFDDLAVWLKLVHMFDPGFEGLVWHHWDGRMAKIKVRDFPKPEAG